MQKIILFLLVLFPSYALGINIPSTPALSSSFTSVNISWTANTDTILGYFVYWGTSSDDLKEKIRIDDPAATTYTISSLEEDTTYYVVITAFDNISESEKSTVNSVKTTTDQSAPSVPEELEAVAITETSVLLKWKANSESDLKSYEIHTGITQGSYDSSLDIGNVTQYTLDNLTNASRYFVAISALDTSDNQSSKSDALIIDTLTDTQAPYTPSDLEVHLSGSEKIQIDFKGNNENMADLGNYKLYFHSTLKTEEESRLLGKTETYEMGELTAGTTYYFAVSAVDTRDNESARTSEVNITVEEIKTLLSDQDSFQGGCFITVSKE